MITLDAAYLTQARATAQAPVILLEIAAWNGTTVRWANCPDDVTFGGQVYDGRPLKLAAISAATDAEPSRPAIGVANQDLAVSAMISTSEPVGCAVTQRRVFLDALTVSQIVYSNIVIDAYTLAEDWATFTFAPAVAATKKTIPSRKFDTICPWTFKSTECAYAGAESTCDHTTARCTELANIDDFGGFNFVQPRKW